MTEPDPMHSEFAVPAGDSTRVVAVAPREVRLGVGATLGIVGGGLLGVLVPGLNTTWLALLSGALVAVGTNFGELLWTSLSRHGRIPEWALVTTPRAQWSLVKRWRRHRGYGADIYC